MSHFGVGRTEPSAAAGEISHLRVLSFLAHVVRNYPFSSHCLMYIIAHK